MGVEGCRPTLPRGWMDSRLLGNGGKGWVRMMGVGGGLALEIPRGGIGMGRG